MFRGTRYANFLVRERQLEPPVDIEGLCSTLGISIYHRLLPEELDGFYVRIEGLPYIVLNTSPYKPITRKRWTLAHELGEYLMVEKLELRGISHAAANRFAGEILMPRQSLARLWAEYACNPAYRVEIIAARCWVSKSALVVQLERTGLIRHAIRGSPYKRREVRICDTS